MHDHDKKKGNPLKVIGLLFAGALFGAGIMSAVQLRPTAEQAMPVVTAPEPPKIEAAAAPSSFVAPVVAVSGNTLVVSLSDAPHKGAVAPTVTVTVTDATTLTKHVPKSPQEVDQAGGTKAVPDTSKGLLPPPEKTEAELFDDAPIRIADLMKDDVVRVTTADAVGPEITATDITLIFRPSQGDAVPAPAGGAASDGLPPPPAGR